MRTADNLRRIRQERGLSYAELSRRLTGIGHPILDTGLLKIEKGDRRIDIDDLVALAVALGTTPNRLLLPDMQGLPPAGEGEITPTVAAPAQLLWAWASGEVPLGRHPSTGADDWRERGEEVVFSRENRPHHWNAPAQAAPASRDDAASRVFANTGIIALVHEAFISGMSTADIRAVFEGAIVTALGIHDPASSSARIEISDGRVTVITGPVEPPEAKEE